ncbi:PREDICTED: eukaryotic translation initiation factor 3 subunit K-like [Acropora digitifera]|uniref:eukaryotic translation initiation factor 3 subunit K-like n=1 Tax=Acropora digitifera TaxID=70779 RepID=UPI00077A7820|nr:PREDICTED: eukaryotic translation initiation factor 3 subunit K-like [Acropora digitifera]
MADEMREKVSQLLKGIDRYNPENLKTLEGYVHFQVYNNAYDVDANLAVLKLHPCNSLLPPSLAVTHTPPLPHLPCGTDNSIGNFFPFVGDELDEWIKAQGWTIQEDGKVFICNQEAHIKSKNIAEKIDFECVAEIIASAK